MTNQQTMADYAAAAKRLRDEERMFVVSPVIDECREVLLNRMLLELDETPLDDIWLVQVGGERLSGGWVVKLGPLLYSNRDGFSLGENDLPILKRGELRALCRALRIPIVEQDHDQAPPKPAG